jgi:alpha-beta hydrolase superfamily lysophospholipase
VGCSLGAVERDGRDKPGEAQKDMARRIWQSAATAVGIGAAALASASAGMGYYVARRLTAPNPVSFMNNFTMTPFETGIDWEDVRIPTANEERPLVGWWFPRPETNRVIIGCAGYRGSKSDLIGIGSALWRAGFNVLLFDYHGHGAYHGAPVTLAYRELNDFFTALDYAIDRVPNALVGVIGFSMGAAIAILGAAQRPDVRVVVADSPFATHHDVVSHNIQQVIHIPGQPFATISDYFLLRSAGYRGRDVAPLRVVSKLAGRPLLLIHGTDDTMIPVNHAHRLFAAAREPKQLWLAPGANHCGAYFIDRQGYCARVISFFEQGLATQGRDVAAAGRQTSAE